jgi:HlyD family secretion protein
VGFRGAVDGSGRRPPGVPRLLKKLLLVLAPVIVIVVLLFARNSAPPEVPFVAATRETLESTLTTNGKVEPIVSAAVRAESSGAVQQVHAERGHTVRKGQLLVTLKAAGADTDVAAARSRVDQVRAELDTLQHGGRATERAEIESGLNKTRAELTRAEQELAALRRLAEKKAATQAQVDSAQQAVELLELQIESLERRRTSLVTPPDKATAQARLQEAQANVAAAQRRMASRQVRSPVDGVLYSLEIKSGAYVNPGDLLAHVGQLQKLRVTVFVDEPELGRVSKGMPVTITWDALPGREWKGEVETVPLQVVPLGTRQVGEVICILDNPDLTLIPGTNVNAEIRSRVVNSALTLPKEAVRRRDQEEGVLKLVGDKVVWQPVKLGVSSVTRVQIVEGLSDGDRVALPVDFPLESGQAVRVRSS